MVRSPLEIDRTPRLGRGEAEAIGLAIETHADLLLADDRSARRAAERRGINVAGTLNVLVAASNRVLLELQPAIEKLLATNFRASKRVIADALTARRQKKDGSG